MDFISNNNNNNNDDDDDDDGKRDLLDESQATNLRHIGDCSGAVRAIAAWPGMVNWSDAV
ncbi:MAG: hypothetical protein LBJ64_01140 [Deltaproteobacteria bacterium]|nr:hypothetical protein [Deltaproteobacteria bacterium]